MVQAQHRVTLADFTPAFQMHHLRRQRQEFRVLGNYESRITQQLTVLKLLEYLGILVSICIRGIEKNYIKLPSRPLQALQSCFCFLAHDLISRRLILAQQRQILTNYLYSARRLLDEDHKRSSPAERFDANAPGTGKAVQETRTCYAALNQVKQRFLKPV